MSLASAARAAGRGVLVTQARYMSVQYKAPVRDISFVIDEVLEGDRHYQKAGYEGCDAELRSSVVEECAKFAEDVLSPLNAVGDKDGSKHDPKTKDVKTPPGWKEAYQDYASLGWQGLSVPEDYGGQGLPTSLNMVKAELFATANWTWGMFPGLSIGCMNTLILCGSEEQKKKYLPKLSDGTWLGTMCLTEPQCGTDLSQVKTKAVKQSDGTYKLTGTKIFISCGEHDFTENIVHIVLARTENAPKGTKGLSLFLVPKFLEQEDGTLAKEKNLTCGSIESKMGIHGSPTCVMHFEDSVGYMIGQEFKGLEQMFVFMNTARIGTALQGLGAAELALQGALPYARDRGSMRSVSGAKAPEKTADPIIHHGDVRRMLLTCKAIAEGARCMMYDVSMMSDYMLKARTEAERKAVDEEMGFLTPILKGCITELGCEAANLGVQCFGGHGYIREWGMEQNVRDARIGTLYEGTTGIQALDLLGRKVFVQKGKSFKQFAEKVFAYSKKQLIDERKTSQHKRETLILLKYMAQWFYLTGRIGVQAQVMKDREVISTGCVDFLMYSGYVSMAYYWLRMMDTAAARLKDSSIAASDREFYEAKIATGKFYFERLLPRAKAHYDTAKRGSKVTMDDRALGGLNY